MLPTLNADWRRGNEGRLHPPVKSFLFPIFALAAPGTELERLDGIVSWCLVARGLQFCDEDIDEAGDVFDRVMEGPTPAKDIVTNFDSTKPLYRAAVVGAGLLNATIPNSTATVDRWSKVNSRIEAMATVYGSPSLVKISADLIWERITALREDKQPNIPERAFRVLLAINCLLGSKDEPVIGRRDQIRALSVGLKSSAGFFGNDGQPCLARLRALRNAAVNQVLTVPTTKQLRDDIELLERHSLIRTMPVSRRATAYLMPARTTDEAALDWLKKRIAPAAQVNSLKRKAKALLKA